jgi:tight adherence protein B
MIWALLLGVLSGGGVVVLLAPLTAPTALLRLTPEPPTPPSRWRGRLRRRRSPDRLDDDLTTQRYLEALARSLRAGRTVHEALRLLAPSDSGSTGPHLVHNTLRVAASAGANPATVIDHAAHVAADRVAARQERRSQAAQARLSASVLTWVPLSVAGLAILADEHVRRVMLTTPLGWTCLMLGSGLSTLGRRWIRRLTEGPAP